MASSSTGVVGPLPPSDLEVPPFDMNIELPANIDELMPPSLLLPQSFQDSLNEILAQQRLLLDPRKQPLWRQKQPLRRQKLRCATLLCLMRDPTA